MSFNNALSFVLRQEGGYVDNPSDHGGATNRGITQVTYDAYRDRHSVPRQDVRLIGDDEVATIYFSDYWTPVGGRGLPEPLDLVCFDSAVNCGVSQASKWLQRAVNVTADGVVGPKTLAAISWAGPVNALAMNVINQREAFYQQDAEAHPDQRQFLNGWEHRISELRKAVSP